MTDPIDCERKSLGPRLREAREARGLSTLQAAEQLHLPHAVIESLENERFEQLGASIYVRGHLRSYLRLLELPEVLAEEGVRKMGEAPPALRTTTHTPRLKYLTDRYAMRAVYVLLTLSIIVPALWVATQHAGLGGMPRSARSLDAPPVPAQDSGPRSPAALQPGAAQQLPAAPAERETVVASMAPFYNAPRSAEPEPAESETSAAGGWLLRFSEDSWVEVLAVDGRRLEYGLVRADSERRFPQGQVARVALGNAGGVEVLRDGASVDLQPFRRANVARFAVSSDGSLQPTSD
ncbi:helix-turn-helix domain-containing protein [Pseudomarimonas salicorniae]|uniref:DUF4115 domain-containing protein n=1 Tax=Pseudomarimonas salicorniae TaxID=2933270 RepID=A0ABT0GEK9_9GAMM|nr:helix-turn-helix domain-containing protein [Lysobacter sp. CAU 1642]MCK7592976.1 DUF4115 domain-containing protein [Lysobacter sp. CAU 1642]